MKYNLIFCNFFIFNRSKNSQNVWCDFIEFILSHKPGVVPKWMV